MSENGIYYKIKKGDTLIKIANQYKSNISDILKANSMSETHLVMGEKIFIPDPDLSYLKKKQTNKQYLASKKNTKSGSIDKMSLGWPIRWKGVTSPFGTRYHPVLKRYILHKGVDLKAEVGVPIYAPESGKITYSGWMSGYGKLIKLEHKNGYSTRYAHLNNIYVESGQYVEKGTLIGKTGKTGRVTGPHLHYEIRRYEQPLNPMRFRK